jgi:hypothetical protein
LGGDEMNIKKDAEEISKMIENKVETATQKKQVLIYLLKNKYTTAEIADHFGYKKVISLNKPFRRAKSIIARNPFLKSEIKTIAPKLVANEKKKGNDRPDLILNEVSRLTGISVTQIIGRSRITEIKNARHGAVWLLFNHSPLTLSKIGEHLGGRDHSTIIHSIDVVNDCLSLTFDRTFDWLKKYKPEAQDVWSDEGELEISL